MGVINISEKSHDKIRRLSGETGVAMNAIVNLIIDEYDGTLNNAGESNRITAFRNDNKTFMGSSCIYGHDGQRLTSSGECVQCNRIRSTFRNVPGEEMATKIMRSKARDEGYTLYVSNVGCNTCGDNNPPRRVVTGKCGNCWSGDGVRIR